VEDTPLSVLSIFNLELWTYSDHWYIPSRREGSRCRGLPSTGHIAGKGTPPHTSHWREDKDTHTRAEDTLPVPLPHSLVSAFTPLLPSPGSLPSLSPLSPHYSPPPLPVLLSSSSSLPLLFPHPQTSTTHILLTS